MDKQDSSGVYLTVKGEPGLVDAHTGPREDVSEVIGDSRGQHDILETHGELRQTSQDIS